MNDKGELFSECKFSMPKRNWCVIKDDCIVMTPNHSAGYQDNFSGDYGIEATPAADDHVLWSQWGVPMDVD
jgi:hypothetical protein